MGESNTHVGRERQQVLEGIMPTDYAGLIEAHGVRVGQVYRHNSGTGAEMEVVYVTPAFAVLHATEVIVGTACPKFRGIPGRYGMPYTETIEQLLRGERDGQPRYTLVRDHVDFMTRGRGEKDCRELEGEG